MKGPIKWNFSFSSIVFFLKQIISAKANLGASLKFSTKKWQILERWWWKSCACFLLEFCLSLTGMISHCCWNWQMTGVTRAASCCHKLPPLYLYHGNITTNRWYLFFQPPIVLISALDGVGPVDNRPSTN